jgi:hypothetical protein
VLSLTNFKWYFPQVSGRIPNSRTDHQANVIGKYMVITFGKYLLFISITNSINCI